MVGDIYGVIYKITNTVNGRFYIGQTTRPLAVIIKHHAYSPTNPILQGDIKKHGKDSFVIESIEECKNQAELSASELFYIKKARESSPELIYNILLTTQNCGSSSKYVVNNESRQIPIRVPHLIYAWLENRAAKARQKDPGTRNGIATQVNAIMESAFQRARDK